MPSTDDGLTFSQAINPNDHGPYVTVTAALLFACSLLFFLFRVYTRWPIHRLFDLDDAATSVATFLGLGQFIATLYAVEYGSGKHVDSLSRDSLSRFYKADYASNILNVACLCFSKLAVALLVQRLTRVKGHVLSTKIISGIILLWGVIGVILVAIPCGGGFPWNTLDQTCSSLYRQWVVVFAFSLFLEAALLALPVYLVWGVQITLSTKFTVIAAFWFRFPVIVFSILRIIALNHQMKSNDYTFQIVTTDVFTQLEMHLCIISATIPCMRPFLKAFDTGYLGTTVAQIDPTATSTKGSKGSMYVMQSDKSSEGRSAARTVDIPMGRLRSEPVEHLTKIEHIDFDGQRGDGSSLVTNASDEMIIRKTVDYKVETTANRR